MPDQTHNNKKVTYLRNSLRRVILLRETGPKSAAWHRARQQTIWRLHTLLDDQQDDPTDSPASQPDDPQPR